MEDVEIILQAYDKFLDKRDRLKMKVKEIVQYTFNYFLCNDNESSVQKFYEEVVKKYGLNPLSDIPIYGGIIFHILNESILIYGNKYRAVEFPNIEWVVVNMPDSLIHTIAVNGVEDERYIGKDVIRVDSELEAFIFMINHYKDKECLSEREMDIFMDACDSANHILNRMEQLYNLDL